MQTRFCYILARQIMMPVTDSFLIVISGVGVIVFVGPEDLFTL